MKTRSLCSSLLVVSIALLYPVCVSAFPGSEDQKIGRNERGQAYRTDASGFKIVDHVAELEVTVDDLQRQIRVLEDELEYKQQALQGSAPQPQLPGMKIRETDLVTTRTPRGDRFDVGGSGSALSAQDADLRRRQADIESKLAAYNKMKQQNEEFIAEIASLRRTLKEASTQGVILQKQQTQLDKQLSEQAKLQQKMQTLQGRLSEKESVHRQTVENNRKLATRVESSQSELSALREQLEAAQAKAEAAQVQAEKARIALDEQRADKEKLASALEQKEQEASKLQTKLAVVSETAAAYQKEAVQRGRLSNEQKAKPVKKARKSATIGKPELLASQKSAKSSLARIQHLISKRKSLADSIRDSGKGVSVSLSPLRTQDGYTLDRLRATMKSLNSKEDVRRLTRGLNQIEALLDDDIQVMKRLSRM